MVRTLVAGTDEKKFGFRGKKGVDSVV